MSDEKERHLRDSLSDERWQMAKRFAEMLDREEWGTDAFEAAAFGMWFALSGSERESLEQIMFNGPVWDGDHISKSARDRLFKLGLAVRCCHKGEQGYTAAAYRAETVFRAAGVHKQRKLDSLKEARKASDYDALKEMVADKTQPFIAALTPAPEAEPGSGHGEIEIPEGFTKWEGGFYDDWVHDNLDVNRTETEVEVLFRKGSRSSGLPGGFLWDHANHPQDIIAYRIISEPAGEGETRDEAEAQPATPYADSCILKSTQEDAGLMFGAGDKAAGEGEGRRTFAVDLSARVDAALEAEPAEHRAELRGAIAELLGGKAGGGDDGPDFQSVNYEPAPLIIADPSSVEELGEQGEPFKMEEVEAEEPLTLDQMDDQGITDPNASAMLRMLAPRKPEEVC